MTTPQTPAIKQPIQPPTPHPGLRAQGDTQAMSRQWEIAEGRFASVSLPADPTVEDVLILEEFLELLKQELTLVWKRKARAAQQASSKDGEP